jgi:hypothetical protein
MKLGEALSLRARQAQQLDDLRGRIMGNLLVQEGEVAAENAEALILAYEDLSENHQELVQRIIRTNVESMDADGFHPIEHLHRRENLRRKRSIHQQAATGASPGRGERYRYTKSELKSISQISVQVHRAIVSDLDEEIRVLDAKIQESNWKIDLLAAF